MIRLKHAEDISKSYEYLPEFKVKQDESGSEWRMGFTEYVDFLKGVGIQKLGR